MTLVPRTWAVRQALEAWGQQQAVLPLLVEKPGRTKDEASRRWHGQSSRQPVEVEDRDGRGAQEAGRLVVVHASQLAQQQAQAYAVAQVKAAGAVADHVKHIQARWLAGLPDAAAAIAAYAPRGQGHRGHRPTPRAVSRRTLSPQRSDTPHTMRSSGPSRHDRPATDGGRLSPGGGG